MEQNGESNGEATKLEKASLVSGSNKSPRKRRKVNHGMSRFRASSTLSETSTDLGTCSCSMRVLSAICKYCIGSKVKERLGVCAYAHVVCQKLIRSGTWPAYDMRFGTTFSQYMQPLVIPSAL
jgi:hypothetical protein